MSISIRVLRSAGDLGDLSKPIRWGSLWGRYGVGGQCLLRTQVGQWVATKAEHCEGASSWEHRAVNGKPQSMRWAGGQGSFHPPPSAFGKHVGESIIRREGRCWTRGRRRRHYLHTPPPVSPLHRKRAAQGPATACLMARLLLLQPRPGSCSLAAFHQPAATTTSTLAHLVHLLPSPVPTHPSSSTAPAPLSPTLPNSSFCPD